MKLKGKKMKKKRSKNFVGSNLDPTELIHLRLKVKQLILRIHLDLHRPPKFV